ncbi:MAG TPA: flagellar basal body protein, partial [Myxococcota bacterium]
MKLFDGPLATLEHSLDIRARRHEVLSSNLANIDTPGWQAKDIDFDTAMQQAQQADRLAASNGSFVGDAGYSGEASILSPMGSNMEPIAMGGDGAFGGDVVDADNLSS